MTVAASAVSDALTRRGYHDHVVDALIAERAPRLSGGPAWPVLRPLLYALLDYAAARRMADAIGDLPGQAALDLVSDLLRLKVTATGLARIPAEGRVVLVCNHPTGIADGIAVREAIKARRPDARFYANADALRVCPGLADTLIPVEWVEDRRSRTRTRETLRLTRDAMEAGRALVIFPAGRLARRGPGGGLVEHPWRGSALSIARRFEAPVVPLCLAGPWSTLFHLLNGVSQELRDITLFHELLNKRGRAYALTVGPLTPWTAIDPDAAVASAAMRAYVTGVLPHQPDAPFA